MYPVEVILRARSLSEGGASDAEVARRLGISRSTVRAWRLAGWPAPISLSTADDIRVRLASTPVEYCYLLGMYLGDGHLTQMPNGVWRLRMFLDRAYPQIARRCAGAIEAVSGGNRVSVQRGTGNGIVLLNYWKGWRHALPQHGPGRKHERSIQLEPWQEALLAGHETDFIRGLMESDGCRSLNTVQDRQGVRRSYPRYTFVNKSPDIRSVFCRYLDALDIEWRQSNSMTISIARRSEVDRLDSFVGPRS